MASPIKAAFLKRAAPKTIEITLADGDDPITLRELTKARFEEINLEASYKDEHGKAKVNERLAQRRLLQECVIFEEPLTETDLDELWQGSEDFVDRLILEIMKLNKMGKYQELNAESFRS